MTGYDAPHACNADYLYMELKLDVISVLRVLNGLAIEHCILSTSFLDWSRHWVPMLGFLPNFG